MGKRMRDPHNSMAVVFSNNQIKRLTSDLNERLLLFICFPAAILFSSLIYLMFDWFGYFKFIWTHLQCDNDHCRTVKQFGEDTYETETIKNPSNRNEDSFQKGLDKVA